MPEHMNTTQSLLDGCCRLMTGRLRVSMDLMLRQAEARLFDMVLVQEGVGRTPRYINAIREMRMKKGEIQIRFENRFTTLFQQQLEHLSIPIEFSTMTTTPEKAALGHAAGRVRAECREVLSSLDKQFSAMLEDGGEEDNPVQPELVLEAFWESCRDVNTEPEIRVLLVKLFEEYVASDLLDVYADIGRYLQSHTPPLDGHSS